MDATMTIDGFGPMPVQCPTTEEEVCQLVKAQAAAGQAVYPVGGGTMLGLGLPPTKPGVALDMRGLKKVVDYPARDMTITVQAGLTIAELQAILQAEGQQLPVDVPHPERATIGGAIATNACGPRRFGQGTLRDYVIGISVVSDRGEIVKGGGRVVKNVAGYDLMKLFTGSLGTLGVIVQVTLKVKPRAEQTLMVSIECLPDTVNEVLEIVRAKTRTRPAAVSVLTPAAGSMLGLAAVRYTTLVAYEEKSTTVAWQREQLDRELPGELQRARVIHAGHEALALLAKLTDFPQPEGAPVVFKANVLPAQTMDFVRRAEQWPLLAHAGNGIVHGHLQCGDAHAAAAALEPLQRCAQQHGGNLIVTRCPSAWKTVVPVWGRATPDRVLMRTLKDKLDPARVFNPGRFVDGL